MKHFNSLATLIIVAIALPYSALSQIFQGKEAHKLVKGAEMVRMKSGTDFPDFVKYRKGKEPQLDQLTTIINQFVKGSEFELKQTNSTTDQMGMVHFSFEQVINGIPVSNTKLNVHTLNGKIVSLNGNWHSETELPSQAQILNKGGMDIAVKHVGAESYMWEFPEEDEHLKWETGNISATYYPVGKLTYVASSFYPESTNLKLAYKYDIYSKKPLQRQEVYVDALTGEVIASLDKICHVDVPAVANTAYSGIQNIVADSAAPGVYTLNESGRGNGIVTRNLLNGTSYANSADFTDTDNYWNNFNANLDEYATDAHWGAEMTYDYLSLVHNRNSIDGNGFTLYSYIHADLIGFGLNTNVNAFWDGNRMTYGDGGGSITPLTAIDIAGHEIAHGLTSNSAALIYSYESGALNESFSDIFGTAIDHYARPNNWNWLVGDEIGTTLRSMSNPNAYGDPDTYLGNSWHTAASDNGGVHINSGVQNKWFQLLVEGDNAVNDLGNAYNVTGLGWSDAEQIAFRNLTVYLTQTSQYADAQFYSILSAIDIFGACSPQVASTTNAWYAVGIGPEYVPYVLSDFEGDITTVCEGPLNVTFNNNSVNGTSFFWDFGDGTTSTDQYPTHTYTTDGNYTVSLLVDGGTCGSDTMILQDYISIQATNPCIDVMPSTGSTIANACAGRVYDPGGPGVDYPSNTTSIFTIDPGGAQALTLDFISFDIEAGVQGTCVFDYLEIYDGTTTNAPLIGRYCNTSGSPGTISAPSGTATLKFFSDGGLELSGFEMTWECSYPNVPPVADFSFAGDEDCTGLVEFEDLSTFGPSTWLWDFGDGTTSTQKNPTHTYTQNGTYSVSLTASNANGSNTAFQNGVVSINKPAEPSVADATICYNTNAMLIASNNGGTNHWYNTQLGGQPIALGDTFNTPVLTATSNYYVEERFKAPAQSVGPVDNSFGGGNMFNNYQHLNFDADQDFILESVYVYSGQAATRTIELRNSQGVVLQDTSIFIPTGEFRIELEFNVPMGTDYQLGLSQNSTIRLYRNNSGPSYPYQIPGILSITSSSANTDPFGYYYFFYDWRVRTQDCVSERNEVVVTTEFCNSVNELAAENLFSVYPNPTQSEINITVEGDWASEIRVIDLSGKTLLEVPVIKGINRLSIEDLASGVYFVELTGSKTSRTRIIKQ